MTVESKEIKRIYEKKRSKGKHSLTETVKDKERIWPLKLERRATEKRESNKIDREIN